MPKRWLALYRIQVRPMYMEYNSDISNIWIVLDMRPTLIHTMGIAGCSRYDLWRLQGFHYIQHLTLIAWHGFIDIEAILLRHKRSILTFYLANRVQRVEVNSKKSPGSLISTGVPHTSRIGPFLFSIYTNGLIHLVEKNHDIVYWWYFHYLLMVLHWFWK